MGQPLPFSLLDVTHSANKPAFGFIAIRGFFFFSSGLTTSGG